MENVYWIIGGIVCLVIVLWLIWFLFVGAIAIFGYAGNSGFVGVAVYFACWFFMFPLMIVCSIIVGLVGSVFYRE